MNNGLIAQRYAKAFLEFAVSRKVEKEIYGRMRLLAWNMSAAANFRNALLSPVIGQAQKEALVNEAAGGGDNETMISFIRLVLTNHRESLLQGMAICYMEMYRKMKGINVVHIISAVPMSAEFEQKLRRDVEKRLRCEAEMEVRVDESLEGGFIFQINDLRLDASVKGQLEKIRRQFIQKGRTLV